MAKRGRRKRSKPDADNSGSGPGRPKAEEENDSSPIPQWHGSGGKRQRLKEDSSSDDDSKPDIEVNVEDDGDGIPPITIQPIPIAPTQPLVTAPKTATSQVEEGSSSIMAAVPEENGLVVKSEPFDPSYEVSDLLLNGSVDSIMDMPLFNEVDSLMNIKHEDHLNDTIFYLPMSYPMDSSVKPEVDSEQVVEATRTLANELAMPNALVYVRPDISGKAPVTLAQQQLDLQPVDVVNVKHELMDNISSELPTQIKTEDNALEKSLSIQKLRVNGYSSPGNRKDSHSSVTNGHKMPKDRDISGKGGSSGRKGSKKNHATPQSQNKDDTAAKASSKKVNGMRNVGRPQSQSLSSNSDSSEDEGEASPISDNSGGSAELPAAALQQALVDDQPEIDRFVICSDHTMECVLCAFTTDSYSAFKSHIICSHPCWRITKKLSKNRLLVERSIKNSSSAFSGGMTLGANEELRTTKGGSTTSASSLHAKNEQELQKVLRKYDKNPRKRQLFERNKRLFKCSICLRLFVFEGSVVNHVTDQHGLSRPYDHIHISNDHGQRFGPIYRCNQKNCYFSCESEHELERHNVERHTQVMYRCQLCGYTADSAEAVRTHGICMHQQQLMCFDTATPVV